ncbi:MAG: signal peptidase I [Pseudonocardia sp.]
MQRGEAVERDHAAEQAAEKPASSVGVSPNGHATPRPERDDAPSSKDDGPETTLAAEVADERESMPADDTQAEAEDAEPEPTVDPPLEPGPAPAAVDVQPEPQPEPAPAAVDAQPEPAPGAVDAQPEPQPEPAPGAVDAQPEPEPMPARPRPTPRPRPAADPTSPEVNSVDAQQAQPVDAQLEPAPAAVDPHPKPQPDLEPQPEPERAPAAVDPQPEPEPASAAVDAQPEPHPKPEPMPARPRPTPRPRPAADPTSPEVNSVDAQQAQPVDAHDAEPDAKTPPTPPVTWDPLVASTPPVTWALPVTSAPLVTSAPPATASVPDPATTTGSTEPTTTATTTPPAAPPVERPTGASDSTEQAVSAESGFQTIAPERAVPAQKAAKPRGRWGKRLTVAALTLVLMGLIPTVLVRTYTIPSESMETTLHGCKGCDNDRVVVDRLVYRFSNPTPGEVVVFAAGPDVWRNSEIQDPPSANPLIRGLESLGSMVGIPTPDGSDFIKRVIAVGGQTLYCCDTRNRIVVDGFSIDEPYLYFSPVAGGAAQKPFPKVTVPIGKIFVMGDNRNQSLDSRAPGNGPVPISALQGKARAIVLPFSRLGSLDDTNPLVPIVLR